MHGIPPDEASHVQKVVDEETSSKKYNKVKILKEKYTRTKRMGEIFSVSVFTVLISMSVLRICNGFFLRHLWVFLCACVLGMSVADFFSGIFHWIADTWGSLETPVIGNTFIRSFREHHLSPTAITKHDLIEANGDNCMITIPLLMITAFGNYKLDDIYYLFVHNFLILLCFWVSLTNQIHKWSHTYKLPFYVTLMMDMGLILSKRDHAIHHRNPFDKFYCITNGWLNPWLANIDFWKRLESVITFTTGAIPREDDMLWVGITAKTE